MNDLLLGVDGSGHTTRAAVASLDGEILGRGLGPPCNHHRVGFEGACHNIVTAVEAALASAHGPPKGEPMPWTGVGIRAAFFGLAGIDSEVDEGMFTSWLIDLGCEFKFQFANDSELILGGGTPDGWGVAVLSGLGSVCVGRAADGRTMRLGGWGYVMGDEGSGYQMVVDAFRLVTQAADDLGGSSALLRAALSNWNVEEAKDLISAVYGSTSMFDDIMCFAARVLDLAGRNDPAAREIVNRGAIALAQMTDKVIRKLELVKPPIALYGAMMRPVVRTPLLGNVSAEIGPVTVVSSAMEAAIIAARRLLKPPAVS